MTQWVCVAVKGKGSVRKRSIFVSAFHGHYLTNFHLHSKAQVEIHGELAQLGVWHDEMRWLSEFAIKKVQHGITCNTVLPPLFFELTVSIEHLAAIGPTCARISSIQCLASTRKELTWEYDAQLEPYPVWAIDCRNSLKRQSLVQHQWRETIRSSRERPLKSVIVSNAYKSASIPKVLCSGVAAHPKCFFLLVRKQNVVQCILHKIAQMNANRAAERDLLA